MAGGKLACPMAAGNDPERYLRRDRLPYPVLSYRGRKLDLGQAVRVYRNLRGPHRYSVSQGGVVVGHADGLILQDVKFTVREAGRKRVLATGRKNVHAWASGFLVGSAMGTSLDGRELPVEVTYNPYLSGSFMATRPLRPVRGAMAVMLGTYGMTATYTH